jgi:hypothetical protein
VRNNFRRIEVAGRPAGAVNLHQARAYTRVPYKTREDTCFRGPPRGCFPLPLEGRGWKTEVETCRRQGGDVSETVGRQIGASAALVAGTVYLLVRKGNPEPIAVAIAAERILITSPP